MSSAAEDTAQAKALDTAPEVEDQGRGRFGRQLRSIAIEYSMVWVLLALVILSSILYPGFTEWGNVSNILSQNAPLALVAIAMTFVIIGGNFDLSVAAILAASGVLYADLSTKMPLGLAIVAVAVVGALIGCVNGLLVTRLKVNSFIATLASSSLLVGATALLTANGSIYSTVAGFDTLGRAKWLGLPVSVWLLGVFFLLLLVLLQVTVFGRSVFAVGGNREAAQLAGIRIDLVTTATFAITGVGAALAGMVVASRVGVGQSGIEPDVTLNSIAIVIIGGTSLMGGEGAMWRTAVGILIFGTITNLFDSMAWSEAARQLVLGGILLAAVAIGSYSAARRRL